MSRVNQRVLNGGHFVDNKNIVLNYKEGLQYLEHFAGHFDKLEIIHGSKVPGKFRSLLNIENQEVVYLSTNLPASLEQTVTNIANRFRDNSRGEDNDEEQDLGYKRGR